MEDFRIQRGSWPAPDRIVRSDGRSWMVPTDLADTLEERLKDLYEDETCRHGRPLHQDCYACEASAHSETVADHPLTSDWVAEQNRRMYWAEIHAGMRPTYEAEWPHNPLPRTPRKTHDACITVDGRIRECLDAVLQQTQGASSTTTHVTVPLAIMDDVARALRSMLVQSAASGEVPFRKTRDAETA